MVLCYLTVVDGILFCAKNNLALKGMSNTIGDTNSGILLKFYGSYRSQLTLFYQIM